jgi:polysaccharide pyruvyl transferase WcaK-like protein
MMKRRHFLQTTAALAAFPFVRGRAAASARPPRVLLRGSWQSVNIGDIGHTMGGVRLLEKYIPDVEVTLWSGSGDGTVHNDPPNQQVRELLQRTFPRLRFADGVLNAQGRPTTAAMAAAWEEADVMVHGSGSGFGARGQLAAFHRATGKPYGVFGVSTDPISGFGTGRDPEGGTLNNLRARIEKLPPDHLDASTRGIIAGASFMYCRDTLSRDYLRAQGLKPPVLEFGPDAQFGMDARDEARAAAYLKAHGLEDQKFICAIPRLRYTPYHRMRNLKTTPTDMERDAINARTTEADHAKVRDVMIRWVRNTGMKVLACPEMTYQVATAKEFLVDPLPADVKRNVVWKDSFWMTDEAASVYAKAVAVVCVECHSPIISLAVGTPTFHVRQPTDTCKGQMFRDVGISDWLFEVDETSGAEMWARLELILKDPAAARRRVQTVMQTVTQQQHAMVESLRRTLAQPRKRA